MARETVKTARARQPGGRVVSLVEGLVEAQASSPRCTRE